MSLQRVGTDLTYYLVLAMGSLTIGVGAYLWAKQPESQVHLVTPSLFALLLVFVYMLALSAYAMFFRKNSEGRKEHEDSRFFAPGMVTLLVCAPCLLIGYYLFGLIFN